jgi:DNA topoisomerase-3
VHAGLGLNDEQLTELIIKRELPVMEGFRSKFGKPFKAGLRLVAPEKEKGVWKAEFYFDDDKKEEKETTGPQASLGKVKVKDQGELELQENDKQWSVPEFRQSSGKSGFSMSRTILGKEIDIEQLYRVLAEGKSELITGFISQRTNRPFDAFLVLDEKKGNVSFEFPPREPRKKNAGQATADSKFTAADATVEDLSKATRHGALKIKGKGEHELLETEQAWHVEGLTIGKSRKPLVIPKVMCGITLTAEIVGKLLSKGKTDLIQGFVSHKSGKNFDAYLVFNASSGRVTYDFPPRK